MVMNSDRRRYKKRWTHAGVSVLGVLLFAGCLSSPRETNQKPSLAQPRVFELKTASPERAAALLSELGLADVSVTPNRNAVAVMGFPSVQEKAAATLELIDSEGRYVVETLAPVSTARNLPTNRQIAEALGHIEIGTFATPPGTGPSERAIIDINGESVVAVIPESCRRELIAFVALGSQGLCQMRGADKASGAFHRRKSEEDIPRPSDGSQGEQVPPAAPPAVAEEDALPAVASSRVHDVPVPVPSSEKADCAVHGVIASVAAPPAESTVSERMEAVSDDSAVPSGPTPPLASDARQSAGESAVARKRPAVTDTPPKVIPGYDPASLPNGEDVLELDLPDQLEMLQLLDLAAEYLDLDYMYDPEKIRGQSVSLRLHGKSQGEVRVKELYPLLESVLKFKGFAMTRHQGNLVTIVPVSDALEVDPTLLDGSNAAIETGDMVVTRIFSLQHVKAASAMGLLNNMRLSVAASPIEETQTLIVTCYAHRMPRIERLLSIVDRPGKPKEFRFRQLRYTMAKALANRVDAIVTELETSPVRIAPLDNQPSAPVLPVSTGARGSFRRVTKDAAPSQPVERCTVYLDADERTNRVLMIGYVEQLATVEEVIDSLDVVQHDPRLLKAYGIAHVDAADVVEKLQELDFIGRPEHTSAQLPPVFVAKTSSPGRITSPDSAEIAVTRDMQVTVLEPTNSLLINATEEQHARVETVINYIDVVEQDLRTLRVYEIRHVDAGDVKAKLSEFELLGQEGTSDDAPDTVPAPGAGLDPAAPGMSVEEMPSRQRAQVAVLESTNALLVNATSFQHARIASIIEHVDSEARQEAIPYEIYFLENQDPESLAEVLGRLVQRTVGDDDGKVESPAKRVDDEITIVPDKGTFSLIVYARKKNQEWISKLVEQLDRRRPQVLIDATLVEVTKTEAFTYDLNLIRSSPDVRSTSSISGVDPNIIGRFVQSGGGAFTAFYGDRHIQTLLQAMQSKNYGRVLAKPKVLVNDNETGLIKAADTTYVETRSGIPVNSAAAGTSQNFVETSLGYESYEAGITLDITPHISDSNLLRLDISLARSDFLKTEDPDRPPDLRSNEVKTTVTVPDGSTIILGGLLKLNQNKGGTKVPILGDVPIVGGLFRSINNQDRQDKLYVFVKAEIIRPASLMARGLQDLEAISDRDRMAFEKHEQEFQDHEDWPALRPKPVQPEKVLNAR